MGEAVRVVVERIQMKRVVACLSIRKVIRLSVWMPPRRLALHPVLLETVVKKSALLDHVAVELARVVRGLLSLKELVKTEGREGNFD
jgi:hypothetical protein